MSDDLELDLPVIPTQATQQVADTFSYPVGFRFAFVGVGQAGGRIAAAFHSMGYARVCAINTTIADLADLKLPDGRKLDIGQARGAGKDPRAAAALISDSDEDIYDLYKRSFGDDVDYVFVCLGAAGGTGAGCFAKAVEVARRYMDETKRPVKVGAIVALPKDSEGQQFAKNAFYTMQGLVKEKLSPVIFIDNQRVRELYNPAASQEHNKANTSTAQLLHTFNRLSGTDSSHTTFDRADFAKLLDSGVVAFASASLQTWDNATAISTAIRDQLKQNVLATTDLTQGNVAGLIYTLSQEAFDQVKSADLDHGTAMMTRLLQNGSSAVFPGVYMVKSTPGITMLAMVGGLPWPKQRLQELARVAGEVHIADFLNV